MSYNVSNPYAEMSIAAQTVMTLETADTPVAVTAFSSSHCNGATFSSGLTGAITAYADYSGTVTDAILASAASHGLSTGDWITIRGTSAPNDYNGVRQITDVDGDSFYFVENGLWNADAGASDFERGDRLIVDARKSGVYHVTWTMSSSIGGAAQDVLHFHMYADGTELLHGGAERKFATNDVGSVSGCAIDAFTAGQAIWMAVESDGTNAMTIEHGSFVFHRV